MNEKINILNDFRLILEKFDLNMNFQYIYVVKPSIHAEQDNTMDGKLTQIHDSFEETTHKIISEQRKWQRQQNEKFEQVSNDMHNMKEDLDTRMILNKDHLENIHIEIAEIQSNIQGQTAE